MGCSFRARGIFYKDARGIFVFFFYLCNGDILSEGGGDWRFWCQWIIQLNFHSEKLVNNYINVETHTHFSTLHNNAPD